ncbi:hypothetical protein E4U47_001379 [Claviceps purpurea]|nr:hypothetical protein E4U47_001379 [Claviceps purpurea]
MSSTSSYRSPANGLNIPNDLGKAEVLCSAPRASTPRPGPSPVTRTPGPRGGLNILAQTQRASNSQRNQQHRRTYLRRANDSGEASLSSGEPTTPKGANCSEGRIFGEVNTSGGASHVEDLGVQCLQAERYASGRVICARPCDIGSLARALALSL